jgi:hypothetical protein
MVIQKYLAIRLNVLIPFISEILSIEDFSNEFLTFYINDVVRRISKNEQTRVAYSPQSLNLNHAIPHE